MNHGNLRYRNCTLQPLLSSCACRSMPQTPPTPAKCKLRICSTSFSVQYPWYCSMPPLISCDKERKTEVRCSQHGHHWFHAYRTLQCMRSTKGTVPFNGTVYKLYRSCTVLHRTASRLPLAFTKSSSRPIQLCHHGCPETPSIPHASLVCTSSTYERYGIILYLWFHPELRQPSR